MSTTDEWHALRWAGQANKGWSMRIDEMRGFACILVMAFHAIGSEPVLGGTAWAYSADTLSYVRMPLFIAISGYLYGIRRDERPMNLAYWLRRMRPLVLPFLTVATACWSIDMVRNGEASFIHAMVYGIWHLWYLQALGWVLLAMLAIDRCRLVSDRMLWPLAMAAALIANIEPVTSIRAFSINGAVSLLPHFLFGAALGTCRGHLPALPRATIYAAGLVSLVLVQLSYLGVAQHWAIQSPVDVALGWSAFLLIAAHMPSCRPLATLGRYALPVFLWHLPVYSVTSAILLNPLIVEGSMGVALRMLSGLSVSIGIVMATEAFAPRLLPYINAGPDQRKRNVAVPLRAAEAN